MHSIGSISARRTTIIRPAHSSGAPAYDSPIRWFGAMSPRWSNQKTLIAVRMRPLSGTGSCITTSNADIRSDATITSDPSGAS